MADRVTHRQRPRRLTASQRRARSEVLADGRPVDGGMPFDRQREMSEMRGCPTPYKRAFETRGSAELGIARVQLAASEIGREVPSRAYECACAMWHLTKAPDRPLAVPAKVVPQKVVTPQRKSVPAPRAGVQDVAIRVISEQLIGRKPVVVPGLHRSATPQR